MPLPDDIKIGGRYVFDYPAEFVTLPAYGARRGNVVTVVRQLTDDEADQGDGMERMFRIRDTLSNWEGDAWASELREVGDAL